MWYHALIVILLLDIEVVDSQSCSTRCAWLPWSAWNACSATCGGGTRRRDRPLCCDVSLTFTQCAASCGVSSSDALQSESCNQFCYNGGTFNGYGCSCPSGYYSSCCQNRLECAQLSDIENGGVVQPSTAYLNSVATYQCDSGYNVTDGDVTRICTQIYSGYGYWSGSRPRCAYAISCSSNPCQNGATCVNLLDAYECLCDYGWSGTNCELDILPPAVVNCSIDVIHYTAQTQLEVDWNEPSFSDPHGLVTPTITAQNYRAPTAVLPWGDYTIQYAAIKANNGMQTECTFQISVYPNPCQAIPAPANGSVACNGWNRELGEICTIFCETGLDMLPASAIDNVYVCGGSGVWFPEVPDDIDCRVDASSISTSDSTDDIRHYDGDCVNNDVRDVIASTYIDILEDHDMSDMCTSQRFSAECTQSNVAIVCG